MTGVTPFTTFPFLATGGSAPRTQPDRCADVKNVLDFGADPTGVNPSDGQVQNAVNWTSGPNRGTIFFPPGRYQFNNPVTYDYNGNLSIHFLGCGEATEIVGGFNGYLFDRSLGSPNNTQGGRVFEKFSMTNGSTARGSGCIRMGSTDGGAIRDCILSGYTSITTEDSAGNSSQNIELDDIQFTGLTTGGISYTDTNAIVMGGSGVITNCSSTGCDVAVRLYGKGVSTGGNRFERNNTAYLLGMDSSLAASFTGAVQSASFTGTISGNTLTINSGLVGTVVVGQTLFGFIDGSSVQTKACTILSGSGSTWTVSGPSQTVGPVSMYTSGILTASSVTGTIVTGQYLFDGTVHVPAGVNISSQLTGTPGGAGTYNLTGPPFNVSVAQAMNTIGTNQGLSGFVIEGGTTEGNWVSIDLAGTCSGFYIGSQAMLGHPASNAGAIANIIGTLYGIRMRDGMASSGVISGCSAGQWADIAGCAVGTATSRAGVLIAQNSLGFQNGSGVDYILPTNAYSANFQNNANVQPIWTFSQLPTGGNVFEGDEFNISDSTVNGWSNNVTIGGGTDRCLVRWNGTHWTVVGI